MKKPIYNAVLAAGYIAILVSAASWANSIPHSPQDNIFMPMAMLSLLTLSVAVMAFLFFYQPVILLIEGKRAEALRLFLSTVGIFALFVAAFLAISVALIP
ncbi:MAG TPA: hypothetical protein VFQ72_03040 [Candidatus Paceibacterota bacterium]|nr:hypothetical protein [Candidatus Paceibacterota bacterium]